MGNAASTTSAIASTSTTFSTPVLTPTIKTSSIVIAQPTQSSFNWGWSNWGNNPFGASTSSTGQPSSFNWGSGGRTYSGWTGWTSKGSTWSGGWSNKNWGSLSQTNQNGGGFWGTGSMSLPRYRTDGGTKLTNGWPWGSMTMTNANPYTSAPNTGLTRSYDFRIAPCSIAPNGVTVKSAICVNGQFPGPMIEANYGDIISVTVHNDLPSEGTSVHWHGMLQTGTPGADGVPGTTQCPIAPGGSYTYVFKATLYGSTWYHAHYSAQYAAGVVGPMVIHGPVDQSNYDLDIGPVMLQDWYHTPVSNMISLLMRPLAKGGPVRPVASSTLINGKNNYPCSSTSLQCTANAGLSRFNFTSGAVHRLRLMNTGSGAIQKFSIDGHLMTVIANDFVPVSPYNTSVVALGVGQRADVLVSGIGAAGSSYWMRTSIDGCSLNDGVSTEALAAIYYNGADISKLPPTTNMNTAYLANSANFCGNDPLTTTTPLYPIAAGTPSVTEALNITVSSNGTNILFYLGNQSYKANYNNPVLFQAQQGVRKYPAQQVVHDYGSNSSVRIVLYNYDDAPHPIHMHGHNIQVLQLGFGQWDGSIVRTTNPQRRDVQMMPPALSPTKPSYLVLQWAQDNPGVWGFHCHFAWHSSMGLFMNVVERPADIKSTMGTIPLQMLATCTAWNLFTATNSILTSAIDSGV